MNSFARDLLWTLFFMGVMFILILWRHYAGDAHAFRFGSWFIPIAAISMFRGARFESLERKELEE